MAAGALLGKMVVGDRLRIAGSDIRSFASLSANPDAATPDSVAGTICDNCPDSFGIGARLGRERAEQDYAYPYAPVTLGGPSSGSSQAIADVPPVDDGYQYGGRFPDTPEKAATHPHIQPVRRDMGSGAFESRPVTDSGFAQSREKEGPKERPGRATNPMAEARKAAPEPVKISSDLPPP